VLLVAGRLLPRHEKASAIPGTASNAPSTTIAELEPFSAAAVVKRRRNVVAIMRFLLAGRVGACYASAEGRTHEAICFRPRRQPQQTLLP
jgi:hypothetical protein